MKSRSLLWLACLAPLAVFAAARSTPRLPFEVPSDLAVLLPRQTVLFAELRGGDRLWREAAQKWWPRVEASPIYQALRGSPDFIGLLAGMSAFQFAAGHSSEAALRNLLGEQVVLGVMPRPGGAKPESLLLMRASDPALARRSVKALAQLMKKPLPESTDDAPLLLALDHGASVAIIGALVAVASDDEAFELLQDRLRSRDAGLPGNVALAAARDRANAGRVAFAWLDSAALDPLTSAPGLLPEASDNPLGQLLVGRLLAAVNQSASVSADLVLDGRDLRLDLHLPRDQQSQSKLAPAFGEKPHAGAPVVPNTLLAISARRDYRSWWEMREDVLDERLKPGLVEFETNMGVLFSGKTVAQLFEHLEGDTHFLLTRQDFGEHGPTVRYPAGAVVMKVKDEKALWSHMLIAFQTAIGFANAERGQKGQAQLLIENGAYREQPIVTTRYLDEAMGGGASPQPVPEYANVRPACAMVNGELVLASSVELARQVIDAIVDGHRASRGESLEALTMQARSLVKILAENEAALVANTMLEKGVNKAAAKQQLDVMLSAIRFFESAEIATRDAGGALEVSARLRLTPSEVAAR